MFSLYLHSSQLKYITRIRLPSPHYQSPLSLLHYRLREPNLQQGSLLGRERLQHSISRVPRAIRPPAAIQNRPRWRQLPRMRFISAHRPLTEMSVLLHSLTSKMYNCGALAGPSKALQCRPITKVIGHTFLVAWLVISF